MANLKNSLSTSHTIACLPRVLYIACDFRGALSETNGGRDPRYASLDLMIEA